MKTASPSLTGRPAWKALETHHAKIRDLHLRELFANDVKRGERLTTQAVGIFLDYSKNRVTDESLKLLLQLAEEAGLREWMRCSGAKRSISRKTEPFCT